MYSNSISSFEVVLKHGNNDLIARYGHVRTVNVEIYHRHTHTHLRRVHPLGDGLLGVGHGFQLARGVPHLAREHVQPLGHLLGLLHGRRGRPLAPGTETPSQSKVTKVSLMHIDTALLCVRVLY